MISGIYQPGDIFDGNKIMGPYNKAKGYLIAGTLSDGSASSGYGGGTCQVSSTLYNALLQLPGINILYRRAHGEDCAPYLPHGVDAAVGNKTQNLRWRNDYDFPIRVEAHTSGDGALCMLITGCMTRNEAIYTQRGEQSPLFDEIGWEKREIRRCSRNFARQGRILTCYLFRLKGEITR